MIALLIISSILIVGFITYSRVGIGKFGLIEQTDMLENDFYFSERLFQLIKEGGSIDYEEYFNRMVLGTGTTNGHYSIPTHFGNEGTGTGFYYCRSGNNDPMQKTGSISQIQENNGCYADANLNNVNTNFLGYQQRYGQYSFQFIDYNSNANEDLGDEDGDGSILRDDDDEFLGIGPEVFGAGSDAKELYLISGDGRHRTYIRWNVKEDEFDRKPVSAVCNFDSGVIEGCRGIIEFLKLYGEDWGMDHTKGSGDATENDGVIDTWLIDKDFAATDSSNINGDNTIRDVIAGSTDMEQYRQPLFSTSINVSDFKVFVYPNIDPENAWKDERESTNISPYVILNYKIKPSWVVRGKIQGEGKELNINSTINLTDIFSK